ncbi:MAG: DsrE family protein [Hyphomicrobiaceae bacterium]
MIPKIPMTLAALLAIGLLATPPSSLLAEGYGKQKVVYHINYDSPKAQAGALRNIQNHINAVGAENLELKVVLHGNGLSLLLEPESLEETRKMKFGNATNAMTAKIEGLKTQGVSFQVCNNTLKGRKISYEEHLYGVEKSDIVPSGVAELAKLQAQGYTYIKP